MILERKHHGSRRKTCPNLTFFTTNPTWIGLGFILGHQGERPANCTIRGRRTKRNTNPSPHLPNIKLSTNHYRQTVGGNRNCWRWVINWLLESELMGANNKWRGLNLRRQFESQQYLDLCPLTFHQLWTELCNYFHFHEHSSRLLLAVFHCAGELKRPAVQRSLVTLCHKHKWVKY